MTTVVAPCARCDHGADEHRLRGVGISGMPTTASVEIVDRVMGGIDVPRALVGTFPCAVDGCFCGDYEDVPPAKKRKAPAGETPSDTTPVVT